MQGRIAHCSIIRTSHAFILCLFSGNSEHVLLLYPKQTVPKFGSSIGKKVVKPDICLHRLVRRVDVVTLKSGGAECHQWPLWQYVQQFIDKASKTKSCRMCVCVWSRLTIGNQLPFLLKYKKSKLISG